MDEAHLNWPVHLICITIPIYSLNSQPIIQSGLSAFKNCPGLALWNILDRLADKNCRNIIYCY